MRTQQCARCKTQVDWPEGETRIAKYGPAAGQRVHVDYEVCLAALNARAEAAEAKTIETLENILLALGVDPNGIDEIYMEQTAKNCIAALITRVGELAANAGEWRPVSEAPVTKGRYLTLQFQEGEYPLYDIQHWHDGTVPPGPPAQWHGGWTKGDDWAQPAYWRPLPTPPEATQ